MSSSPSARRTSTQSSNSPPRRTSPERIKGAHSSSRVSSIRENDTVNKDGITRTQRIRSGVGRDVNTADRYDPERRDVKYSEQQSRERQLRKQQQKMMENAVIEEEPTPLPPVQEEGEEEVDIYADAQTISIVHEQNQKKSDSPKKRNIRIKEPEVAQSVSTIPKEEVLDEKKVLESASDLVRKTKQNEMFKEMQTQNKQGIFDNELASADLLHSIDDIMTETIKTGTAINSMENFRLQLTEEIRKQNVQQQLMRGQIERRDFLLEEQRETYLKELMLLREELFKKNNEANYEPTDFMLHSWVNRTRMAEIQDEKDRRALEDQETERMLRLQAKRNMLNRRTDRDEEDRLSFNSLRTQTRKVSETLMNLKKLEMKRKKEIDALRRQQRETDRIRKRLQQREQAGKEAEERERLERERLEQLQQQLLLQQQQLLIGKDEGMGYAEREKQLAQRQLELERQQHEMEERFRNQNAQLMREDSDDQTGVDDEITIPDNDIQSMVSSHAHTPNVDIDEKQPKVRTIRQIDEAREHDEEQLFVLENQIQDFHSRFKTLNHQMEIIKQRLQFYNETKQEHEPISDTDPVSKAGPTGNITLVFTDVQDSTVLWELDMEAMRESIKVHNTLIRGLLVDTNGFEVKTEGDAFMCAFTNTHDAVEFCMRAQLALINADWPESLLHLGPARVEVDPHDETNYLFRGLRVRMGVHVGEPIVEQDPTTGRNDYFGPVVNRAARVESQAAGGQCVISDAVWDSIVDGLQDGFSVRMWTKFMGTVTLKGMDEPETIRMILPYSLRERKFKEIQLGKEKDHSSIQELKERLELLQHDYSKLEEERSDIHNNIHFKLKIKSLEDTMHEKDNIIKYLKDKLDASKELQASLGDNVTHEDKIKYQQENEKLLHDIETVMQKYDDMKSEYETMRSSYDEVVKVFNLKLKSELEAFKTELTNMRREVKKTPTRNYGLEEDDDNPDEDTPENRRWRYERQELKARIQNKEKLISDRDTRITQLKNELKVSLMNNKVNRIRTMLKKDVSRSMIPAIPAGATRTNSSGSMGVVSRPITPAPNLEEQSTDEQTKESQFTDNETDLSSIGKIVGSDGRSYTPTTYPRSSLNTGQSSRFSAISEQRNLDSRGSDVNSETHRATSSQSNRYAGLNYWNSAAVSENSSTVDAFRERTPSPQIDYDGIIHHKLTDAYEFGDYRGGEYGQPQQNVIVAPLLAGTMTDVIKILRKAIRDALKMGQKVRNFDWSMFVQGQRTNNVDAVNSTSPSNYMRRIMNSHQPPGHQTMLNRRRLLNKAKLITVRDDVHQQQDVTFTPESLHQWGVDAAVRLMERASSQQPPPKLKKKKITLVGPQKPVKQSYSRMLENYYKKSQKADSPSQYVPSDKDYMSKYIHDWEPLGSPFRKLKRARSTTPSKDLRKRSENNPQSRSVSALGNHEEHKQYDPNHRAIVQKGNAPLMPMGHNPNDIDPRVRSNSAPLFEDMRNTQQLPNINRSTNASPSPTTTSPPPPRVDYTNMTREQRRQEILRMLYYDRNAEHFQGYTSPDDHVYNKNDAKFGIVGTTATDIF
jgi:class 3 adenylate cyclase